MPTPPMTRPSLLLRIRDAEDREAWVQFVDLYAPLVYRLARRHGLQDADSADLTQEVMQAVSRSVHRLDYNPERGTFRAWLYTVARNRVHTFLVRRSSERARTGSRKDAVALEEYPAQDEGGEQAWEQEYEQRLFDWAAEQVRGDFQNRTWQAFWQTAAEGRPPAEVALQLGISVGAVYIAKSRVLARLREHIRQLQDD